MSTRLKIFGLCTLLPGLCGTCDAVRSDTPPVQDSSSAAATSLIRVRSGQAFTPSCVIVESGATVEWRNLTPSTAISMVSIASPYELSSPALHLPYNTVPAETSDECVLRDSSGCLAAVTFSFWRHTFTSPGVYGYHDVSNGSAASQSTYGMPPGTPSTSSAATGTVCVRPTADSTACDLVCCTGTTAGECAASVTCINGRCGGVT